MTLLIPHHSGHVTSSLPSPQACHQPGHKTIHINTSLLKMCFLPELTGRANYNSTAAGNPPASPASPRCGHVSTFQPDQQTRDIPPSTRDGDGKVLHAVQWVSVPSPQWQSVGGPGSYEGWMLDRFSLPITRNHGRGL